MVEELNVLGELTLRKAHYENLRAEQRRADKFYELEFFSGIPEQDIYKERRPSTAREWVAVGVRNYTLDNPLVRMVPRGQKKTERKADADCETLGNFFLNLYSGEIKKICNKALLRGETLMKIDMDDAYFGMPKDITTKKQKDIFEGKRLRNFPLTLECIDPLNCYPSPAENHGVPVDVIEEYEITIAEALNMCHQNKWAWTPKEEKYNNTDIVTFISYVSDEKKQYYIEDIKVHDSPNIFGFVPYFHIDGGMGQSSYTGEAKYKYRSIIFPQIDALKMEARAFTFADAIISRIAFRRTILTGDSADVDILYPKGKVPTDPDEALRAIKDKVEVTMMDEGNIPNSIFEMLGMLAQKASAPAALSGGAIPGVYSAQHREDVMATSLPLYKDTLKAVQKGLETIVSMGLKIIDSVYKHDVQVSDINDSNAKVTIVGTKQIAGYYDCTVQLLAEPPEATDMRKSLGSKLRASGDISMRTMLMKYFNYTAQESEDEIVQIAAENALLAIQDAIGMDALAQLGMDENLSEMEALMAKMKGEGNGKAIAPGNMGTGYDEASKRGRDRAQGGENQQPGVIQGGAGES